MTRKNLLFTHIIHGNPRTTSALQGLNAQIRDLLRRHHGISEEHHRRTIKWFLTTRELDITQAITTTAPIPKTTTDPRPDNQTSHIVYDTGISAEEGLWARSGHVH